MQPASYQSLIAVGGKWGFSGTIMLINESRKYIVDAEWVACVIEVLDRRSDNQMTDLGMLSQTFGFAKINEVPGNYFELGLWRGRTFGYAHWMKRRYGRYDMRLWDFDSFQGLPAAN